MSVKHPKRKIKEDMPSVRQKVESGALSKAQEAIYLKRGDVLFAFYERQDREHEHARNPHKMEGRKPGSERMQERHVNHMSFVPDTMPMCLGNPLAEETTRQPVKQKIVLEPEFARVNDIMLPSMDDACSDLFD